MASKIATRVCQKSKTDCPKTPRTDYYAKHSISVTHIGPLNQSKALSKTQYFVLEMKDNATHK